MVAETHCDLRASFSTASAKDVDLRRCRSCKDLHRFAQTASVTTCHTSRKSARTNRDTVARFGHFNCYKDTRMENQGAVAIATEITFHCGHCNSPLVTDSAAAGMTLDCRKCGKPVTVPQPAPARSAESTSKITEIRNRLKENESQRTEVTGYINQLSIQLHRWQLRLQTLNERKAGLEAELRQVS